MLVKSKFLSLDPYMRGRMNRPSLMEQAYRLAMLTGETVGEVITPEPEVHGRRHDLLALWLAAVSDLDGNDLRKVDPKLVPISTYLGVVGMPGVTAWVGLLDMASRRPQTVVVAAASGAVEWRRRTARKIKGARAVGVAGGEEKCDYVVKELGFDACVDHRSELPWGPRSRHAKGRRCVFEIRRQDPGCHAGAGQPVRRFPVLRHDL